MSTKSARMVRFDMGSLYMTPHARDVLSETEIFEALMRHSSGDWGDVEKDDWEQNEFSLHERLRLYSVYHTANGVKLLIITEADRSSTTVLMPEDY